MFDGEPADERSDIYALGITAYEILAGQRPYPEESASALMKLHRTQDIPDPAESVADLPEALRRFILKACRRDPVERYQSVRKALADLRPLAGEIALRYKHPDTVHRKTAAVVLFYNDEHQQALQRLLEKFGEEAKELGINLIPYDFPGE